MIQFCFAFQHSRFGVLRPYLPDLAPNSKPLASSSRWRPSSLPKWSGPDDFNVSLFEPPAGAPKIRWLPVDGERAMDRTPAGDLLFNNPAQSWADWRVAAQQHYSFLENLERGELRKYHFNLWDKHFERVSINLIAIAGDDIQDMMPMPGDDEKTITVDYSRRTGRRE